MTPLFIYYLKATISLTLFYAFYRLMFDHDTFFSWKRALLIGSIVLSVIYPFIDITSLLNSNEPVKLVATYYINTLPEFVVNAPQQSNWWHVQDLASAVWLVYMAGVILFTCIMLIRLGSIFNLRRKGSVTFYPEVKVIRLKDTIAPFSFFKWIFINPGQHTPHELKEILAHERTHVREWHSLDVLFSQIACIVFWFNPIIWLTQRAIRQNLEYLADHRVIHSGFDSKGYQYHLLRLTHHTAAANLGNNFNVSELKKRIVMMNKQKSPSLSLTKYALLLPLVSVLIVTNHAEALAKKVEKLAPVSNLIQTANQPTELKDQSTDLIKLQKVPTQVLAQTSTQKQTRPSATRQAIKEESNSKEEYVIVEQMPQYPGGQEAMFKFLAQNIKYPAKAQDAGIQGMVILNFIVNKTGEINNINVVRSIDPLLDNEAIRVVKQMPNWVPGKQGGKNVNVKFTLPVRFALDNGKEKSTQSGGPTVIGYGKSQNNAVPGSIDSKLAEFTPLVIIDGKESSMEILKSIDPKKVDKINVMKDASATSIYGEKGKNGVIIVELKKE